MSEKVLFRCYQFNVELNMPKITDMKLPNWKKMVKVLRVFEYQNGPAFIAADHWFNMAVQKAEIQAELSGLKSDENTRDRLAKFYKIFKGE